MWPFPHLNRRHKVALFFTLAATGVSLIAGVGLRVSFGVVLIGVALAWAFGTDNRVLHALYLAIGLSVAAVPLILEWDEHHAQRVAFLKKVAEFQRAIPQFAKDYPVGYDGQVLPVQTVAQLDQVLQRIGIDQRAREVVRRQIEAGEVHPGARIAFRLERPAGKGQFTVAASDAAAITKEQLADSAGSSESIAIYRKASPSTDGKQKYRLRTKDAKTYELTTESTKRGTPAPTKDPIVPSTVSEPLAPEEWVELSRLTLDLQLGGETKASHRLLPEWQLQAIIAGVDLESMPGHLVPWIEPERFSVRQSTMNSLTLVGPGLLLAAIGASLLLGIRKPHCVAS